MSCTIRRWKVLFDASAAETGDWVALNVRYDEGSLRAIQGDIVAGDTITIQGTTKDVKGIDKSFLDDLEADEITDLGTYTSDFNDILTGPWTYIRVVKTGTTGSAKVMGMI